MWAFLFGGTAALLTLLIGFSGFVAVWVADPRKRADAYRVLKLVLTAVTGAGGVTAVIVRLHEAGVL
ncbi:hypothetical protein [Kutzneria albida]|uniref:Uncharacterized protein n=1 Tax=Kutzneria albida DSM 43870 TaxID=1449976 RepID=W5WCG1_9PSEU|nr:hypothetical protein [Kutzneria albida]AHH98582.1 hypothetical protein KALB_5220 [Kutzneria albida DSM 43870]